MSKSMSTPTDIGMQKRRKRVRKGKKGSHTLMEGMEKDRRDYKRRFKNKDNKIMEMCFNQAKNYCLCLRQG